MSRTRLLRTSKECIDNLPPDQLKVAAEFLRYLAERASEEATRELLSIPGLVDELEKAEGDRRAGHGRNWRKVRRDV